MEKKLYAISICLLLLTMAGQSQNVGIGTTNPQSKLHVAGGLKIDTLANGVDSGLIRHDKNGAIYSLKFTGNANEVLRGDGTFGVFTSGTPTGPASGDLSGSYPNPNIANGAVTSGKIATGAVSAAKIANNAVTAAKIANNAVTTSNVANGAITMAKLASDVVLAMGGNPTGPAGGDLTGSYPNPVIGNAAVTNAKLADNTISTSKLQDGSVTLAKLGADVLLSSGNPTGPAGGDLAGNYPNPSIGIGAVQTSKLADNSVTNIKIADYAVTTSKILDATITASKLVNGVIPTSLPPNGIAGGELSGSYPNPIIGTAVITTAKIANNAVTTAQVLDGSITLAKLGADVILGGGNPTGPAGGELSGTYPNPSIATAAITTIKIADNNVTNAKLADNAITTSKITDGSVTAVKLAAGVIPTSLPPGGTAGGDLTGTYPNPTIATAAITTPKIADGNVTNSKLADNAVTTSKITDGSVTAVKLAAGVIPTSLPPGGTAGGDLGGTYPNPFVAKLQGVAVNTTAPLSGQVLKYNGSQWTPGADLTGITLPYAASASNAGALLTLSNTGAGTGIEGINTTANANTIGISGKIAGGNGNLSTGVKGQHYGTGANGIGVWGLHNGGGRGVLGETNSGDAVAGVAQTGNGVFGTSNTGAAGYFDISNFGSTADALFAYNVGAGTAMTGISEGGNGIWGITYSPASAAVLGYNTGGGEGIVGRTFSNSAAAIVGNNDGTFAGVQGTTTSDGGTGVLAVANVSGAMNANALVAEIKGSDPGNPALFKANNLNVARIDQTGKGFFNGGTQVGGADVAEYFDVTGNLNHYEAGDVLVISLSTDRTVEKSTGAYSTLVAGVYATKPGLMLTEKDATANQLEEMVPMGVIGVIPTKVCGEGGPIKRGDILVTSSTPGMAMKADLDKLKPGQAIGKALQEFDGNGIGKIQVLVSVK